MSEDPALLVAAIDFGTTYSGYAFSLRHEFQQDPLRVSASSWTAGSRPNVSLKTSSCILFNPRGKFDSFGFDAEDKYSELVLDRNHREWFYFRRFKMMLYKSQDVHRTSKIRDETGKEMPALDVFSAAIHYLKEHLLQICSARFDGGGLDEKDTRWVLTVPAIWSDQAKQFMREAAEKAGIQHDRLVLALEPEAASMYCKYLPVERMIGSADKKITCFQPQSKYLVLDAGGGTIDITVHEVQSDGTLRELCKANGGDWGGTKIDQAFVRFIADIVGDDVMFRFKNDCTEDYIDLMKEFEVKKRNVQPETDSKITFRIPIALFEIYRDVKNEEIREAVLKIPSFSGKVSFAGDKMRIDADVVKAMFDKTITAIVDHIKSLLIQPEAQGVTSILMVGGFSESAVLMTAVQRSFPSVRVIVPNEAGLAVLKGAVIFGHNSKVITSRIAKYTYGLKSYNSYDPNRHPTERILHGNGGLFVRGCFSKLVEVGQPVSPDEPSGKELFYPVSGSDHFAIKLFASPRKDPVFVDETDCIAVGQVHVDCRDKRGQVAGAYVWLIFGGTELQVKAQHETTGEQTSASFDLLE